MPINITSVRTFKLLYAFCYRCNYILVFAFILSAFQAKSQTGESLLRSIDSLPKNVHDSIYYELFKVYRISDTGKAKHYARKSFHLSGEDKHFKVQAKASRALAYLYDVTNQPDSASLYFHIGIKASSFYQFDDLLIDLYNDFGLLHERLDVYDSALHYFTLSYNLASQNKSYRAQAIASHNIGLVYSYVENYTEAAVYFKQAIQIKNANGITNGLNINLINLSRVFNEQGLYNDALEQLKIVALNCKNGCDDNTLTGLNYGLGFSNLKKRNQVEAYGFFTKALVFAKKSNDKQWLANTLYQLASFSITNTNYSEALQYLSNAEKIAQEINHRRLLRDTYSQLAVVYDKMGNENKARQYEKLHWHLKDSIFNEVVANNLKNIQLSEQRKQSNVIIEQKETALEKSYILTIILAINCAMAFAIVYLIYRSLKTNKINKKEIDLHIVKLLDERENKQKELFRAQIEYDALSGRVRSFLSGPVATLGGLGHVFKNVTTLEELHECADKLLWLTSNIQAVLENMDELVLTKKHEVTLEDISINALVDDIRKEFAKMSSSLLLNVTINNSVCFFTIKTDKTLLLALLSNAIRYFNQSDESAIVEVLFDQRKTDSITKVSVRHYAMNTISTSHKNQFNLLTVLMASGKLNAETLLTQHDDYTGFEIFIPTHFTLYSENQKAEKVM